MAAPPLGVVVVPSCVSFLPSQQVTAGVGAGGDGDDAESAPLAPIALLGEDGDGECGGIVDARGEDASPKRQGADD